MVLCSIRLLYNWANDAEIGLAHNHAIIFQTANNGKVSDHELLILFCFQICKEASPLADNSGSGWDNFLLAQKINKPWGVAIRMSWYTFLKK